MARRLLGPPRMRTAVLAVSLVVLVAGIGSVAEAQPRAPHVDLDPATLSVLHDPAARRARMLTVRLDIEAAARELASLDRTPLDVTLGVGIALAAGGAVAGLVGLVAALFSEIGEGVGCVVSTAFSDPCEERGAPGWVTGLAIGGLTAGVTGILVALVGVGLRPSLDRRAERIERRREGRERELELLRSVDVSGWSEGGAVSVTLAY